MISISEMKQLAAKLLKNTQEKKISWSPSDQGEYICGFPRSSVVVRRGEGANSAIYGISVQNSAGEAVGVFNRPSTDPDGEQLRGLYLLAERQALSIDETLDDILTNLK